VELARRGWTQQDLARAAAISEVHISRLLSRSEDKSKRAGDLPDSWAKIFEALELDLVVRAKGA
jgi:DNA-binding Xre family transcriptional regulator